jgi:hypothetical protein
MAAATGYLPPITGMAPLNPPGTPGVQRIHLYGSGFLPGMNAVFTSDVILPNAPGGQTSVGYAAGSVVGTGGPLINVSIDGSEAFVNVNFAGGALTASPVTGGWSVRITDPKDLSGQAIGSHGVNSPWLAFQVLGPAITLVDPNFSSFQNADGSVGIGTSVAGVEAFANTPGTAAAADVAAQGAMGEAFNALVLSGGVPITAADAIDAAATAATGITTLKPGYTFNAAGYVISYNAGAANGGSPPDPTAAAASGPAPGGGMTSAGISQGNGSATGALVAAAPATSATTWWLVAAGLAAAYFLFARKG